jgi:Lon-like protease
MHSLRICAVCVVLLVLWAGESSADYSGQLTVLAADPKNPSVGVYEYVQIFWDQKSEPQGLQVRWNAPGIKFATRPGVYGGVKLEPQAAASLASAVRYAVERTPGIRHSGTVTMIGTTYLPARNDGPSAGAAMAVALMAMFNGTSVRGDVCMTGTLEPGGRIGKVGAIPQKMRAAWAGGCHLILVPQSQILDNNWDLNHEALAIGINVQEVETIDEAYALMVGRRL